MGRFVVLCAPVLSLDLAVKEAMTHCQISSTRATFQALSNGRLKETEKGVRQGQKFEISPNFPNFQ